MIVKTWMAFRNEDSDISENEVRDALLKFDGLWDELFPAEQARINLPARTARNVPVYRPLGRLPPWPIPERSSVHCVD
jgi:hypothetical protein